MKFIPVIDVGNPKGVIAKRVIDFILDQQNNIKSLFEKTLNLKNIELSVSSVEDIPPSMLTSFFLIENLGSLQASLSCRSLDNLFCKHLNIPTTESDLVLSHDQLTYSHVNFFNRQAKSILEKLFNDKKIDVLKNESEQKPPVNIKLSLSTNDDNEDIYISFSDELLNYFSDGLKKQSDFNSNDVQQRLNQIPFNINIVLMKSELSISDINNITVGDFIEFHKHDLLDVNVEDKTLFQGQLIVGDNAQLGVKYA